MIKRKEQWINYAKPLKKQLFFFEDKVLDLTAFMSIHPGGRKALNNYIFKDITDILFTVYPHKRQPTLNILLSYSIGMIPLIDRKVTPKMQRQVTPKDKRKVCFVKNYVQKENKPQAKVEIQQSWKQSESLQKSKKMSSKRKRSKSKQKSKESLEKNIELKKVESISSQQNCSAEDIDEKKPIFKVPILSIKRMVEIA